MKRKLSWKQKMILAANAFGRESFPYGRMRCVLAGAKYGMPSL